MTDSHTSGPETFLLHIGCGFAPELSSKANRIVLIEPNPACWHEIRTRISDREDVELISMAVAAKSGHAQFHVCNLNALSGLRLPGALFDLLPGLKSTAEFPVKTISIAALMSRLGPGGQNNILICDAPGATAQILKGLEKAESLPLFHDIKVTCGIEPFFGKGTDVGAITDYMLDQGFRLTSRQDTPDPDWPRLSFRRDEALVQARKLFLQTHRQLTALRQAGARREKKHAQELGTARDQLTILHAEKEVFTHQNTQLQTELEQARLWHELVSADLLALQTRHAELVAEKERQDIVLAQLMHRLGMIAEDLQCLEDSAETSARNGGPDG